MLKHPQITRRRIGQFLKMELLPAVEGERVALRIETNTNPAATSTEAEKGPWEQVAKGYVYGPAYTVHWFRISGTVPAEWAGRHVAFNAEIGGERTLWKDGEPWRGIDVEHSDMGLLEGKGFGVEDRVEGGEDVSFLIQVYTRNSETTVAGREKPRSATTEVVTGAEMFTVDRELKTLAYDFEWAMLLFDELPETDPGAAGLLRALNDVCNLWARSGREAIVPARRLLATALGNVGGKLAHTIVPVGHAHLDTAWLWPLAITRLKMAHTTSTQLAMMERYPEFVFVHSQASQYEWLETEHPGLFNR
ncbi:hypothetical protein EON77_12130, partial [bacterium]